MLVSRRWFVGVVVALVLLVGASCGDDDSSDAAPPAADAGSDTDAGSPDADSDEGGGGGGGGGGGAGGGGTLVLGDETIELDSSLCYLESQPSAAGGGEIEMNAQASGTNAAGDPVTVSFSRYSEDSDFAGDDISVNVGAPGDGSISYAETLEIGGVSVEGNVLEASDVSFMSFEDGSEVVGSFVITC